MQDDPNAPAAAATALSGALKELHRALIRSELGDDPALANPYTMLFALINDPRFAWMGALSTLIARIDQTVVDGEAGKPGVLTGLRDETAALIGEGGGNAAAVFRQRHLAALQKEPGVGLATGGLRRQLARMGDLPT